MQSSVGDRTQLTDMIIKWALSCKMSYDIVKEAHETAIKMEDALTKVCEDLDTLTMDAGAAPTSVFSGTCVRMSR